MKTEPVHIRPFIYLQCFLLARLIESSSLGSASPLLISSTVGNQAVLPCSWRKRLESMTSTCYVQWARVTGTVFERRGSDKWEADAFENRLEVPEETLRSGNCSLIIKDVQIGDTGTYESFMVVKLTDQQTKVFIQGIKLLVFDHKSRQTLAPGEDLLLELHTSHSLAVSFQHRDKSESSDLWVKGQQNNSPRLVYDPLKNQLTLKNLSYSDEGTYKVLDKQGLAISTMKLTIEERTKALKVQQPVEKDAASDAADRSSRSALLSASLLLVSFRFSHLFW
ncbi:uncharacterized protein LOC115050766 [Echeneis naucrates]|uniref:Uncharacterized LOC115050766 n=1 Tax=Echeneis naucrates TaxID=173247 RepID=A0A665U404_ECHNA|nr:uncharacterized protein LOC115050766 [Echeneis naucrates]